MSAAFRLRRKPACPVAPGASDQAARSANRTILRSFPRFCARKAKAARVGYIARTPNQPPLRAAADLAGRDFALRLPGRACWRNRARPGEFRDSRRRLPRNRLAKVDRHTVVARSATDAGGGLLSIRPVR